MATPIVVPAGRSIAEVSWPAYSRRQGGTCDFMTEQCKKHCILMTNHIEKKSFAFFEDNEPHVIVRRLIEDINELNATVLCWFIGSGDCPRRMTGKLIEVVNILSDLNIRQHGFTRNIDFWWEANQVPMCTIALTVEKGDAERYKEASSKCVWDEKRTYLIAEPNYNRGTVRIFKMGEVNKKLVAGCGVGWVISGSGWTEKHKKDNPPPKVTVEDCSLCLENNDGCFSLVESSGP